MIKKMFFLISMLSLCACEPMNTTFSCHQTAYDRCLSIEAVHAMTEPTAVPKYALNASSTQTMWIAPWVDKKGVSHHAERVPAMHGGG